eukprot:TRINITY_DN3792_c0_g1_i1.p1 TRINITY_DN3792_c0_g1~~TRINITY_DN3792_c0_g1_i1.p1  ORF type:complete len:224 (+),score=60.85 TRINITY_DN3792_c0_g1_i1:378-1049(+)
MEQTKEESKSIINYSLEDEFLSLRDSGLHKEVEADLETLKSLKLDILSKVNEAPGNNEDEENEDNDSVDEDNFFLEHEESCRGNKDPPGLSAGKVLQGVFKDVLGLALEPKEGKGNSHAPLLMDITMEYSEEESLSDTLSVHEIFDEFQEMDKKTDTEMRDPLPNLSCPFVTMGCDFSSNKPKAIADHIKHEHRSLDNAKECCGSLFKTRMEYYAHLKREHNE